MIVAISILGVSFVCLAALVVFKDRALESSRVPIALIWLNRYEATWERGYWRLLRVAAALMERVRKTLQGHISRTLSSATTASRLSLIRWGERVIAAMKRGGQNKQRGAASLYLKEIKEYKDALDPNGKIEQL